MKTITLLTASLSICILGAVALLAQGFDMRTGAWSMTMTMEGGMPMDGLPAAARAAMEAEMKKPQVFTSCVTPEDLKNLSLGKTDDDEDCTVVSMKATGKVADLTRKCEGDEPSTETSHFEAATPQTLKGTVAKKTAKGTMTINLSGKWVADTCKN